MGELSEERSAIQARDFIGKGCRGGGQEGEGNGENRSATWLTVSGFLVIGLVSGLSLASHSELDPSWGHTHHSAEMDSSEEDPGKLVGPLQNPGWWELVSSLFLTRTSCCKMTPASAFSSLLPGKGGWSVVHFIVSLLVLLNKVLHRVNVYNSKSQCFK